MSDRRSIERTPPQTLLGSDKEWIEGVLEELEFVEWDRYIQFKFQDAPNAWILRVYGWIPRDDPYMDFVTVTFNIHEQEIESFMTSSEEYTEEIGEILGIEHEECLRVETMFEIENMIKTGGEEE